MSAMTIAISLVANDATGGAFSSAVSSGSRLSSMLGGLGQSFKNLSPSMKEAAVTALAAAVAFEAFKAPTEYGIKAAADLQYSLVTLNNAVQDNSVSFPVLTSAINDLAIRTVYGSEDAAQAFGRLTTMGFNAQQVLYGMSPAAASLMDGMYHAKDAMSGVGNQALILGQALQTNAMDGANLLGSALHVFSGEGLSAAQVANSLAAAYLNGVPDAQALSQAIAMSGSNASTAHVKLNDYLITLDLLTQNGMSASSAGASLNYMLQALISPTEKQSKAMAELGIETVNASPAFDQFRSKLQASGAAGQAANKQFDGSVTSLKNLFDAGQNLHLIPLDETFTQWALKSDALKSSLFDASGNFVGMKRAIEILDTAMNGMTVEQKMDMLGTLFNVRSGRAAKVLTNIQDFSDQYDAIAKRFGNTDLGKMAERQLATFTGAFDSFKDSFKSLMATIFLPILPAFASFFNALNTLMGQLMLMPNSAKVAIAAFLLIGTVVTGITAALLGIVVVIGVLAPLFAAAGVTVGMFAGAVLIVVGVVAGAVALFFAFKAAIEGNRDVMNAFRAVLGLIGSAWGVLTSQVNQLLVALRPLAPFWDGIKFALMAVAVVIVGVLLGAVLAVIGVFIALVVVVRVAVTVFTTVAGAVNAFVANVVSFLMALPGRLQAIWSTIVTNAVTLWHQLQSQVQAVASAIATFLSGVWTGIVGAARNAWSGLVSFITGMMANISGALRSGWNGVVGIVQGAVSTVVGWFQWLYNHNYYFQDLVDGIRSAFTNARNFITSTWSAISSWLASTWHSIASTAQATWSNVTSFVQSAVNNTRNTVTSVWSSISSFLSGIWNSISGTSRSTWNNITSTISSAMNQSRSTATSIGSSILSTITSAWNSVVSATRAAWNNVVSAIASVVGPILSQANTIKNGILTVINSLGSLLFNSGQNAVHMLANGIAAAAGHVIAQAQAIASKVAGILGFHSPPPEGPLHDSDEYMPNMMKMYAAGIESHLPTLASSLGKVGGMISGNISSPTVSTHYGNAAGGGGTVVIPITIDGKEVARYTLDLTSKKLQQSGSSRYAR